MKSYVLEFASSGVVCEGSFSCDTDAVLWAETVIESHGVDADDIVSGDWDADGRNDDGEPCYRMLFWASEADAANDDGGNALCQLSRVGR